jgi:hypothetical protein
MSSWIITFLDVFDITPLNHLLSNFPIGLVSAAKMALHAMAKHLHDANADIAYYEQ